MWQAPHNEKGRGQRTPLNLPKGAARPHGFESAAFPANSDDGIMMSYTREREAPGEVVSIRVSYNYIVEEFSLASNMRGACSITGCAPEM